MNRSNPPSLVVFLEDAADSDWLQRALRKSCSKGALKCARLFLENGANPLCVDDVSGRSYLHIATMAGHSAVVVMLVEESKVDTSLEDMHGRKALHYAAMGGHDQIVKFLLQKNVGDLTLDQDGSSPLVYAVTRGHVACVSAFLEFGGDSVRCKSSFFGNLISPLKNFFNFPPQPRLEKIPWLSRQSTVTLRLPSG